MASPPTQPLFLPLRTRLSLMPKFSTSISLSFFLSFYVSSSSLTLFLFLISSALSSRYPTSVLFSIPPLSCIPPPTAVHSSYITQAFFFTASPNWIKLNEFRRNKHWRYFCYKHRLQKQPKSVEVQTGGVEWRSRNTDIQHVELGNAFLYKYHTGGTFTARLPHADETIISHDIRGWSDQHPNVIPCAGTKKH